MADYSAKIAEIDEILAAGVQTTVNDGVTVTYDLDALRRERRRLTRLNDATKGKRPLVATVRLDGAT